MGPSLVLFFFGELSFASKSCFIDHFPLGCVLGTALWTLRGLGIKSRWGEPRGIVGEYL